MQSGSARFTTVPLKPESDEKCVKYLKGVYIFEFSAYKQNWINSLEKPNM